MKFPQSVAPIASRRSALRLCIVCSVVSAAGAVFAQGIVDGDADGVPFDIDECPYSRPGEFVDERGCTTLRDSDEDGIADVFDDCPLTQQGAVIGPDGCSIDTDKDGVADGLDQCPGTPSTQPPDTLGCSAVQQARRQQFAAEPGVVVGRPRPSTAVPSVAVERPRPAAPEPRTIIEAAPPSATPVVSALQSRPAAVFSASGRGVEFIAFDTLAFAGPGASGPDFRVEPAVPVGRPTVQSAQLPNIAAQDVRFARAPAVTPPAVATKPNLLPASPEPAPAATLEPVAISAQITPALPVRSLPVPPSAPSVAAVSLTPPAPQPVFVAQPQRAADPAAFSPMAQAVAQALLGLAPEPPR